MDVMIDIIKKMEEMLAQLSISMENAQDMLQQAM